MTIKRLLTLSLPAAMTCISFQLAAQRNSVAEIAHIAKQLSGRVGVYALLLETGEHVSYHGRERFPMQSVYKFPIAMAVLGQVDKGRLSLTRHISVDTSDYISKGGHSPLRDKFPDGTTVTVKELLRYSVAESDGSASDVLLQLLGGTQKAETYIRSLGIKNMAIEATEKMQVLNDTVQYRNWSTPEAMSTLFGLFYAGHALSRAGKTLLIGYLSPSSAWFNRRIKGLLPPGTAVIHKTGTSGTLNGLTRATNDAGVITLPDGRHVALSVFIADSYAPQREREGTIARISLTIYDYYRGRE